MKQQHIFVFFISLLLFLQEGFCQEEGILDVPASTTEVTDSIAVAKDYYGLRIGIDLAKPLRSVLDENYTGLEVTGDFRIKKNYYIAAEIGNETRTLDFPNINSTSRGSYIKAGFNYNAYENWFGMNNLIYAGLRAGFSSFRQELNTFTIFTTNPLFGTDTRMDSQEFNGLNTTWLEFQLGLQVEIVANFYLGLNVQLKRRIIETAPEGFENLYIPGFGQTTDDSNFGVGYGYTVSYLIPIFKK